MCIGEANGKSSTFSNKITKSATQTDCVGSLCFEGGKNSMATMDGIARVVWTVYQ